MSSAPNYSPSTSFATEESNQVAGRSTVRTTAVDIELANISSSINALNTNIKLLQRDDGHLLEWVVEPFTLSEATRALIATGGNPRGDWQPTTNYAIGDLVQNSIVAYICYTAHTSGLSFSSAGFWITLSGDGSSLDSAQQAAASAAAALVSENNAAASAAAALLSKNNASASATSATNSATSATNSATAADGSATSASNSAASAGISAAAAGISATNAANTPVAFPTHAATSKTTPAGADEIPLIDSASSFTLKKLTWANLKEAIVSFPKNVTNRAPQLGDYKGISSGDTWQFARDIWIASRVFTTGNAQASWERVRSIIPAIGGTAPSNLRGCYWLKKVVPAYAGNCIRVTNEATTTALDIGFLSNGDLDMNSLMNHLQASRGLIDIWYDQSGNGNNLTASGTARPILSSVSFTGDQLSIIFEKDVIYNGVAVPTQALTIPVTLTANSNAVSIFSLVSFAHSTRDAPICELAGATFTAIGKRRQSGADSLVGYVNSGVKPITNVEPSLMPEFVCLSSASTGINMYNNDTTVASAAVGAVALAGGQVGATTSLFVNGSSVPINGGFGISGLSIYNKGISTNEYRNIYRAACRDLDFFPQVRGRIIFDGDSITEGAFATNFENYPRIILREYLRYPCRIYNVGISGGNTTSQTSSQAQWLTQIYSATNPFNLLVVFMGTNDLSGGDLAVDVYARLKTYIQAAIAAGYSVIVGTCLPRSSFISTSKETERLAYNTLIRDQYITDLGCIGIIDFANERTMGSNTNVISTIYYADGTHPTPYGYSLLAIYAAEYINRVIEYLTN
jgi:lysophospholipase L1-like esterase